MTAARFTRRFRKAAFVLLAPSVLGAGTVDEFHSTWVWTRPSVRPNSDAVEIADLQGDGIAEILVAGAPECCLAGEETGGHWFVLEQETGNFRQVWSSLGFELAPRGVAYVPGENAGIVVWSEVAADVYDPGSKALVRSIPLDSEEILSVIVADVDGQPGREMIACDLANLFAYDFESGAPIITRFGFGGTRLEVGQADEDSALEIAVAGNPLGGYVLDGTTWQVEWGLLTGFDYSAWLVDLDGDALDEVVVTSYDTAEAFDPRTGSMIWSRPGLGLAGGEIGGLGSGGLGVVGYSFSDSALIAISAIDGSNLWSVPFDDIGSVEIAIGNLDSDPASEVLLATPGSLLLVAVDSEDQSIEALAYPTSGPFRDLSVADLDADGFRELATTHGRIVDFWPAWDPLIFDLSTRTIEVSGEPASSSDGSAARSVVVQADGDVALELCVAVVDTFDGGIVCVDGSSLEVDFQVTLPDDERPLALAAGDVDSDGNVDLVVASDDDIVTVFGGAPFGPLWTSSAYGLNNNRSTLRVGQIDSDPALEVVLAGAGWERDEVVVLDGSLGALQAGPYAVGARAQEILQVDPGAPGSIVIGTFGGDVAVLDLETGQLLPPLAIFGAPIGSLRSGDLNRDGIQDLVIGVDDRLVVRSGSDGQYLWTSPYLYPGGADWDSVYVGDYDGNTVPEILVGFDIGFAILEAPSIGLFQDGFETGDTSQWDLVAP